MATGTEKLTQHKIGQLVRVQIPSNQVASGRIWIGGVYIGDYLGEPTIRDSRGSYHQFGETDILKVETLDNWSQMSYT